ncbi:MAG: hypothetical protein HQL31_00560 [Planctomycetes bacterium]|nr:hypothetical protein [Planctomycetota bacterium]
MSSPLETYNFVLNWLLAKNYLGFIIVIFVLSFSILLTAYLIMSNLRLHLHIRSLNKDKARLMEEKDLMRQGAKSYSSSQGSENA